MLRRFTPRRTALALVFAVAACAPAGTKSTGNTGADLPPELAFCRGNVDTATASEIALRTAQNLGTTRVPEQAGRELDVRIHPDGVHLAFTRQRTPGDARTGEIIVAQKDSGAAENRLTANLVADDHPCWSPNGDRLVFVTERNGGRQLYVAAADGTDQRPFLTPPTGAQDDEPDWHRGTDRLVFTRRDAAGLRRLWLVNGDGSGAAPLTAGAVTSATELGQHEPAFAPDGSRIVFVDVIAAGIARLFTADVGTGDAQPLFDPQGDVRRPRWSPQGDRIFCGLGQPLAGRPGLRLAVLRADGTEPLLIEPGKQWQLFGVDVFAGLAAMPTAPVSTTLGLDALDLLVSAGAVAAGNKDQLASADGQSIDLATETFNDHEIAALECMFTLPVAVADDVVAVRASIVASVSRSDANTTLRASLYSPVTRRYDTVAEVPVPGTGARTLTFATQSLAHVSLERQVRYMVIGEIGAGARALLHVDQVELTVVHRDVPALR